MIFSSSVSSSVSSLFVKVSVNGFLVFNGLKRSIFGLSVKSGGIRGISNYVEYFNVHFRYFLFKKWKHYIDHF